MPEERGVDNNESSSASSTCGDTSISSNSAERRSSTNERNTTDTMSGAPASGHTGESSSATPVEPNSAPVAPLGDATGGTNATDTSPTSLQRHRGGNTPASATSSPPDGATPEPLNLNVTTEEGDGGTDVLSKSNLAKKTKDCHEIVKTSAVAGERRGNLCSVHQNGIRKAKVNVACQTDTDEAVMPRMPSQCSRSSVAQPPVAKATAVATASTAETSSASSSTSSDGTLRLMIQNFKNMSDTVRGPSKKIQAVPWRIMVMPRQHVVQKKGTQKCLGFFLQCCPDAYSDSWSCQAAAELRLISQKQGVPHFTRKTNHVYTAKENDWGYSCFMTWADILDESQGYIKEDKVILEVSVKAEPPKNILTHDQFEKKIQDYMRLADIQSSRGLIDKAIEVNLSALKFCKDRDQDCKAELEAQKTKLIEMKLKQSIERIEKGPPIGKNEEESSLNQNALKQAISGTPATLKQSGACKSTNKGGSSTKARDSSNVEKNGNAQNRSQTPPPPSKTVESQQNVDNVTNETRTDLRAELLLSNSPYKAPWVTGTNTSDDIDNELRRNVDFGQQLEEVVLNEGERLSSRFDAEQKRFAADKSTFITNKQNELIRTKAILENISALAVRNNPQMMSEIKKVANESYEEELRRQQAFKRMPKAVQQKKGPLSNLIDMDPDKLPLNKLGEEQELAKGEQQKVQNLDNRSKKGALKQADMEEKFGVSQNAAPVWRNAAYKADLTGQRQPWEPLTDEGAEIKGNQGGIEYSSDDETATSGGVTSDSEAEGNGGRTALGVPVSKKMKRCLDGPEAVITELRDECDSCIEAMLEPSSVATEEASCQTDFPLLNETNAQLKNEPVVVTARGGSNNNNNTNTTSPPRVYAQPKKQVARKTISTIDNPKYDDPEWRKKKLNELKEVEVPNKKAEEARGGSQNSIERLDSSNAELTRESIARFTSHFANPDPALMGALPQIYHPSPQQIFGDDLPSPQLQRYLEEAAQPNVWSRQYIEEWLKFNIKYCWKYMKNGENSPGSGGEEGGIDLTSGNIPHFNDAQVQQVMAALSVIGVNCVNAKRVVDKAAEFINTLETRSKSPFLRECLQKLAFLAGDEKAIDAPKDSRKNESSLDSGTGDEHIGGMLGEEDEHLSVMMSSMECPDDTHDYMLNREVQRIGVFADQAVSKNPLMELGQAEKLNEHTEKIAARIALLECDKENLTKQLNVERERLKKSEQKHANTMKQIQAQLQAEKEKHEKTVQQLNQKKNELKKQEKVLKQHERDAERCRELQDKVDYLTKELQEMRQKNADEVRKLQRELQSSQDTRKNMADEIKGREAEQAELRNQLSERSLALKRSENTLSTERKTFQNNLAAATERAKKTEIMYLELKLETGLAVLERAYKDAGQRVKDFEMEQKKVRSGAHSEELKIAISEWRAKREEVASLIASSKAEFAAQIEQIKSGKQLSQLPRISVAKPPPAPKSFKINQFVSQPSPIASEKPSTSAAAPSPGVIGQTARSSTSQAGIIGTAIPSSNVAPGSPVQSISKAPAPPSTVSPMKSPMTVTSTIAPIGVRPTSHVNGTIDFGNSNMSTAPPPTAATAAANSSLNPTQPPTSASTSGISIPNTWGSAWEGSLAMNSINELLNPSRSFGPIGTDYGITNATASNQLSQPPPGLANAATHFGSAQSNGWGNTGAEWSNSITAGMNNGGVVSGQHAQFGRMHQTGGYQSPQWAGGWAGYRTPQAGGSPDVANTMLDNSRSSSPRRDVVLDSLRTHFPQISPETLKEYASEFMLRNNCATLKNVPITDIVSQVAQMIASKQMWNKTSIPPMMHQPPPNVMVQQSAVGMAPIESFQSPPSRLHTQQSVVHSHVLMQQQLRDGMEN
uniref:Ubiquitin carboxyl-terminal hydrolase 7 n=1 Tax=Ascaris suum TaxID=6253 RepID=F1KPY2_ASCSU